MLSNGNCGLYSQKVTHACSLQVSTMLSKAVFCLQKELLKRMKVPTCIFSACLCAYELHASAITWPAVSFLCSFFS